MSIQSSKTVLFTRPRGLHLHQAGVLPGELLPASLFDVAMIAYQADLAALKHPLCFYIRSRNPRMKRCGGAISSK